MHSLLIRTGHCVSWVLKRYGLLLVPLGLGVSALPAGCRSDAGEAAGASGEPSAGEAGASGEPGNEPTGGTSGKPSTPSTPGGGAPYAGGGSGAAAGEGGSGEEAGEGGVSSAGTSGAGESGQSAGGHSGAAGGPSCVVGTGSPGTGSVPVKVVTEGRWAAWQDGDGPWLPLVKSGNGFVFRPTGTRYGVAIQCGSESYSSSEVIYGTTAQTTLSACPTAGVARCEPAFDGTVKGTLSNVGSSQWLATGHDYLSPGHAISPSAGSVSYSFELNTNSLLLGIAAASGQPLTRVAVLRNVLTPETPSPATVNIDFNSAGKATTSKNLVISGLSTGDTQSHHMTWTMAGDGCGNASLEVSTDKTSPTDTYAALDPSFIQSGDRYEVSVTAKKAGDAQNTASVSARFNTAKDVTLPVLFSDATGSLAAAAPYPRAQASFTPYPNASGYVLRTSCTTTGTSSISWMVTASSEWLGSCSGCKLAMPDLSAAACWNDGWVCSSGNALSATFNEQARSGAGDSAMSWSAWRAILPTSR